MKKILSNLSMIILAASTASAQVYYPGSNEPIECIAGELTCAIVYGVQGYTVPFDNPGGLPQSSATSIELIDLSFEE